MSKKCVALCMMAVLAVGISYAADVSVTDYSWLQLPSNCATPFVGNSLGATSGSGNDTVADFRWGGSVWIPSGSLTNNGAADWWAGLMFDQARSVKSVKVQWWVNEGTALSAYLVQGTTDGTTWVDLADQVTASGGNVDTAVKPELVGNYLGVRVRLNAGNYTCSASNPAGRGGPGIHTIEPYGDGTVSDAQVNWANKPNLGTVGSMSGLGGDVNRFVDGWVGEWGNRTGNPAPWASTAYAQVDLGTTRTIGSVVVVWDEEWYANVYRVRYSTDGTTFSDVTGVSGPVNYGSAGGALKYSFDPVSAQYLRFSDMGGTVHAFFFQLMAYSPAVSTSPASVTAFAVADQSTGSPRFTNTNTVNVTAFTGETTGEGAMIASYNITESETPPTSGWLDAAPETYTFSGTGYRGLFAWVKDTAGNVSAPKSVPVLYDTAAVAISNYSLTQVDETTLRFAWTTPVLADAYIELKAYSDGAITNVSEGALLYAHQMDVPISASDTYRLSIYNNEGLSKLTYFPDAPITVDSFAVADATTDSSNVTDKPTVKITEFTGSTVEPGATIDGWAITEVDITPTTWLTAAPATFTFAAAQNTNPKLYAWVKDTAGNISSSKLATIFYSPWPTVTVTSEPVTDFGGDPPAAEVIWNTDVKAESSVVVTPMVEGGVPTIWPESDFITNHNVAFEYTPGTQYKIVLVNNEYPSNPIYWPDRKPSFGGDVTVLGYNWLQTLADMAVASVGSDANPTGAGSNGAGVPADFRWGSRCWIPNSNLNGTGTSDYWAAITFDKPRNVYKVRVEFVCMEGMGVRAFRVEGTTDGETWTEIGKHDFGSMQLGSGPNANADVPVTDGIYSAVRLRLVAGEYQYAGRTDRSGPGLFLFEPYGDGGLNDYQVNWANKPNFNTSVSTANLQFNGTAYNTGTLSEYNPRTGAGSSPWPDGSYAAIDLATPRSINRVILTWEYDWKGATFSVEYSTDNAVWTPVSNPAAPTQYASQGATGVTFDAVTAQYIRVVKATPGASLNLFTQMLVYGPRISAVNVDTFAVASVTGSPFFSRTSTVDVTGFTASTKAGRWIAGYLITENDSIPMAGSPWQTDAPINYTITGPMGPTNLYAWAIDSAGDVSTPKTASLYYGSTVPVVSNVVVGSAGPGAAIITWNTDITTEASVSVVPLAGGDEVIFSENALITTHSIVITGLTDGVNYRFTPINNDYSDYPVYYPSAPDFGGDVAVYHYSWLQTLPDMAVASIGSTTNETGAGGSGNQSPSDFRWGNGVWIPGSGLNGTGTSDYWAAITFDQPRNVYRVRVDLWVGESTGVRKFHVEGTTDGTTWTEIGAYDFGTMTTGTPWVTLPVTNGDYLAVRVRFNAGEYAYGSGGRSGPGLQLLEPIGDGGLRNYQANWANQPNFNTFAWALNIGGAVYNSGTMTAYNGRTGDATPWKDGQYACIDLGATRSINRVILRWNDHFLATNFLVETSADNLAWTAVSNPSAVVQYPNASAGSITFDPVSARYLRVSMLSGGSTWNFFSQMLVFGPKVSKVAVDTFAVADQSTGSALFTNSATVAVSALTAGTVAEGAVVTAYMITESDGIPSPSSPDWLAEVPSTYTIKGAQGNVNLFAWAKDSTDEVSAPRSAAILYSTALPVMSNLFITPGDPGSATATWDTDIQAQGMVKVKAFVSGAETSFPENAVGTSHSVTISGLAEGVIYKLFIINNEVVSGTAYYPGSPFTGDVTVKGYNWLQLPAASVTAAYGSDTGVGGGDFSPAECFRWGTNTIPNGALTGDGTAAYWATIILDKPRNVYSVAVQLWTGEGTSLKRFTIEGSTDGTDFTEIGALDYGVMITNTLIRATVAVTDGDYQYIRVKVSPGDYIYGSAGRGGPGFLAIEPVGDGGLFNTEANWANQPNFATTVENANMQFNGLTYNDGWLFDDDGGDRTGGSFPWFSDVYAQVNLPVERSIAKVVLVWDMHYVASMFDIETSTNGTDWAYVSNPVAVLFPGATEVTFDAVTATNVRISYPLTTAGYAIFNQMMVYSAPPAPPSVTIDAFAAADTSTGSAAFTNAAGVSISLTTSGSAPEGYGITEANVEPAEWATEKPTACTITGGEGTVTLYAWVKVGTFVTSKTATILYGTATPVPSNTHITGNGGGSVTVTWNTDIPAEGGVNWGVVKLDGSTPNSSPLEGSVGTSHSVTLTLSGGASYKLVLVNNEKLSSALLPVPGLVLYWPAIWPIPADVNRDCKVNILDLISIRNKLNQPVSSGDNIYADVNLPVPDGKINILDLIAVRNKLNTSCPQ